MKIRKQKRRLVRRQHADILQRARLLDEMFRRVDMTEMTQAIQRLPEKYAALERASLPKANTNRKIVARYASHGPHAGGFEVGIEGEDIIHDDCEYCGTALPGDYE